MKEVEATAADEVTVILEEPNVQFAYTPAHMAGFIFKKEQLADKNIRAPEVLPLGTGPYKPVKFVPPDQVILEARDDYWGPKPVVKRITLRKISNSQDRRFAMQSGAIDGAFDLSLRCRPVEGAKKRSDSHGPVARPKFSLCMTLKPADSQGI